MAKARIGKEIWIETPDEVGKLAKICGPLAEKRLNLNGICAWAEEGKGTILLVAEDATGVAEALQGAGFKSTLKEVVLVEIDNSSGALLEIAQKLSQNGVGINSCYVTAAGGKALGVFSTADNQKAVGLLG